MIVRQALRLSRTTTCTSRSSARSTAWTRCNGCASSWGRATRFPDTQAFHEELLSIFTSVRDLHTTYKLPKHFHQRAAVLPFRLEEYFEADGTPRVVVSRHRAGLERAPRPSATARRSSAASW